MSAALPGVRYAHGAVSVLRSKSEPALALQRYVIEDNEMPAGNTESFFPAGRLAMGNEHSTWKTLVGPSIIAWSSEKAATVSPSLHRGILVGLSPPPPSALHAASRHALPHRKETTKVNLFQRLESSFL